MTTQFSRVSAFAGQALRILATEENDLLALAQLAYKYIGSPVIISDKNWRTLAMFPDDDIPEDQDWMQFRHNGMLSLETVTENMKADLAGSISASREPFFRRDSRMRYGRLYCNVMTGDHAAATVSVLQTGRAFTPEDHALVSALTDAVSASLQKREKLGYSRGSDYEKFLADLLDGETMTPGVANERAKSLGFRMHRCIGVFVVDFRSFDSGNYSLSFLRDYIERVVADSTAIIYNNTLVLIKSAPRPEKLREAMLTDGAHGFLSERSAVCGIGRFFEQISDLREAYRQATVAITLGTKLGRPGPFYFYDDLVIYHFVSRCGSREELMRLCSPRLLELMEYDKRHNTAFSKTLHAYFANNRNITQTAQALNMHRNSAIYHLKKIEELLSIRLNDAEEMLYLELSFRFLEYAEAQIGA